MMASESKRDGEQLLHNETNVVEVEPLQSPLVENNAPGSVGLQSENDVGVVQIAPQLPPRSPIERNLSSNSGTAGENTYGNTGVGPALPPRNSISLTLREFVDKYSEYLPAQVEVVNGHYGSTTSETLVPKEKFAISYIKDRNVLSFQTRTKTMYYLPLGSAVQLSLLYNPEGNEEKARNIGYTFQSVSDLIKCPYPIVICATKTVRGDAFWSTVHEREILIVERYDTNTKRLHVISLGTPPLKKYLPLKCKGYFTTKPSAVRMYVSDIVNNIYYAGTSHSTHDAILYFDQRAFLITNNQQTVVKSLHGIVQLQGFITARSLVCCEHIPTTTDNRKRKVFEIPVDSNLSTVQVTVTETKMTRDAFSFPSPNDYLEPAISQDEDPTPFNLQMFFYDYVRVGHERDGVALCDGHHVYAEVQDPIESASPSLVNVVDDVDVGSVRPHSQNDSHTPSDIDSSSGVITKADLEGAIRSVLKEMMPDQKKSVPQTDTFTKMASYPCFENEVLTGPGSRVKLNSAVMELNDIENLWYFFGIHLGIQKSKLDQIHANHGLGPNPAGRCLIEVISQWQDNTGSPTWTTIAQALYSMGKKQLAKEVASKHGVMPADLKQQLTSDDLKEFIAEDKLSTVESLQQELQEKDQHLGRVKETLRKYEQKMEKHSRELTDIKRQQQFNERFTRMYTTEHEVIQKKQAYYEQHMLRDPCSRTGETENAEKFGCQERLRKKDYEKQKAYSESRLNTARQEATELKQQLFLIKSQTEDIKDHLHRLQDQKHKLEKGLHEQEQQLNHIVTGMMDADDSKNEELPQYYNIIRCDGRIEVKLHEEELSMLQQDLERKTNEVDSLKKELEQKHKSVTDIESSLAKQALDDEVKYSYAYADATVTDIHERHKSEHTKNRLEMELIECQIQLTKACFQKREVESKLQSVDQRLERSKMTQQKTHKVYEKIQKAQKANRHKDGKHKETSMDPYTEEKPHQKVTSISHSVGTSKPAIPSSKTRASNGSGQAEKSGNSRPRTKTNPGSTRPTTVSSNSSSSRPRYNSTSQAQEKSGRPSTNARTPKT